MNTLLSNSLRKKIRSWDAFCDAVRVISEKNTSFVLDAQGLAGCLPAFFIESLIAARSAARRGGDVLCLVAGERDAQELAADLAAAAPEITPVILPWWGTLPYRSVPRGSRVFGERAKALAQLASSSPQSRIFIVSQWAAQTPVPPAEYIQSLLFSVHPNERFDPVELARRLTEYGYTRVPRVTVRGEFTLRGEVLDIFLPGEEYASRIVFVFDTVEAIKSFDPETQSSIESLSQLLIYPMKELIWSDEHIARIESAFLREEGILPDSAQRDFDEILTSLYAERECEGEEVFYPLAFEHRVSIFDYLNAETVVVFFDYDRLHNAQQNIEREYEGLYRKSLHEKAVPPPKDILFSFDHIETSASSALRLRSLHTEGAQLVFETDPPQSFFGNIKYLKERLSELTAQGWSIYVFGESEAQALRIAEVLKEFSQPENSAEALLTVIPCPVSAGFAIPSQKILVIQENEIFGRRKYLPKTSRHAKSAVIDTFIELEPGDFVVHVNYGIGQFLGIERVKAGGNERDYIKLAYAEEETVFIPIEQVNLVQRYIGNEGAAPKLDRLGSKNWENRKNRVKKSVEDLAQRLIDLYSRRQAARGFAFPADTEWQTAFEAAFPYEETDDQLTVSAEVKTDMERPIPMDRLVCGDVGYGKTEIAMRAAFKAVMGGKQVALLAPTTILAEQHYESFEERFEHFPVRIAHLSRFVARAEQNRILQRLAEGSVDILIGTHRIIQKDVKFKDLGLLVIDEEQRFGVKDKERLKELKTNVDCLAMSATPIPRTLHMSLLKIRDMSLLKTPPQNRQSIETVIDEYSEERVAQAIRMEAERGGQVFYLHNRVESLEEVRITIERLVPEMLVDTAHGRMSAVELDDIFRRFKLGGFHVLVSTTIIENGIDIPNVNTIIIDRADMYGVSQLYQLRGRVGRSDRKAYAFLFYPQNRALSEIAMKRLQVISDFTELGAGFKIAMKDMEIRGAGSLLGRDQSGDVYSVGFDLYLRLLEDAVRRLSDAGYEEESEVLLELDYSGFVPDTYISNPQTKMEVYKKIAAVGSREELDAVHAELFDRFGPLPDEVSSLLALADIRVMCRELGIASLREKAGLLRAEFKKVSRVNVDKVIRLMRESGGRVRIDAAKPNILILETGSIALKEKSEFIRERLELLS